MTISEIKRRKRYSDNPADSYLAIVLKRLPEDSHDRYATYIENSNMRDNFGTPILVEGHYFRTADEAYKDFCARGKIFGDERTAPVSE